ncbi:cupin domain-containing protein [Robbsia andropogonis]|uniref:cupin domain-containing protein n=1 Tax=Robbsia andropogonis TaxID=28092 RepID=UPI000467B6AF|nr:cupin domain-containing protein [Robbsia andropogonis]MCP1120878.1 cupin domain-containing protein [Robbsia andropogonis]MCP1130660.1 cupin domain-containing protein [Robbsia andropogonis]
MPGQVIVKQQKKNAKNTEASDRIAALPDPALRQLDIGQRLKELRLQMKLSIRGLAEAAGLTHSTIAQIESNKVSPSIGSMKRILDVMNMPLSAFFAQAEGKSEEQIFFAATDLVELADGQKLSYRQVGYDLKGKAIMMLHERYAPGADTGEAYSHEAEECGMVVKGRLMVVVGSEEQCVGAGEAYYFDSRLPHRMYNPFDEVCEVVSAASPPTF